MSQLANAIKAAGMDDEEAADVRALIVKHDGDVKKGLRAYLDELEEDRLDLGRQLKEQGFDLSPRQLRIEPDVAGRPLMTPIRNPEHALVLEAEADAKTKRGFGRRVTKGEPSPKPGFGRHVRPAMSNAAPQVTSAPGPAREGQSDTLPTDWIYYNPSLPNEFGVVAPSDGLPRDPTLTPPSTGDTIGGLPSLGGQGPGTPSLPSTDPFAFDGVGPIGGGPGSSPGTQPGQGNTTGNGSQNPGGNPRSDYGYPQANWSSPFDPYGVMTAHQYRAAMIGRGAAPLGSDQMVYEYYKNLAQRLGYDLENLTPEQELTLARNGVPPPANTSPETQPDMGTPEGLRKFIKDREGFLTKWQLDKARPDKYVTGGWGTTELKIGDGVQQLEDLNRQENDWEKMFEDRLVEKQEAARDLLGKDENGNDKWDGFTPRQQGALTSLVYNIGQGAFAEKMSNGAIVPTNLITALKAGDLIGAAEQWLEFNNITKNGVLVPDQTLSNSRWAEVVNFLGDRLGELTNVPAEYRDRLPGRGP